jgi:hypothetical protein
MELKKMHRLEITIELSRANGGGDSGRFIEVNAAESGSSTLDFNALAAGAGAKTKKLVTELFTKIINAYGTTDTIEVMTTEDNTIVPSP